MPLSLLGKGWSWAEAAGGDLNEEGGGVDIFGFLAAREGTYCGGTGNWARLLSSSMSEHKKSRVTAVRSADAETASSSSVMEISMGGSNRTGGDFSIEFEGRWEWVAEGDMTESELVDG